MGWCALLWERKGVPTLFSKFCLHQLCLNFLQRVSPMAADWLNDIICYVIISMICLYPVKSNTLHPAVLSELRHFYLVTGDCQCIFCFLGWCWQSSGSSKRGIWKWWMGKNECKGKRATHVQVCKGQHVWVWFGFGFKSYCLAPLKICYIFSEYVGYSYSSVHLIQIRAIFPLASVQSRPFECQNGEVCTVKHLSLLLCLKESLIEDIRHALSGTFSFVLDMPYLSFCTLMLMP